jgi:adenosylhomocysteine nucleosidase
MVLRYLLRNWLQQAAQQKIRETVSEAARRGISPEAAQSETSAEPQRCDIGAVFALSIESGGLEDLLGGLVTTKGHGFTAKQGNLQGRKVVLLEAGAGLKSAAAATELLIAGHQPQWVISAGFAGGLSPNLKRHDILMADSLVDEAGNGLTIDLKVDPASLSQSRGVHVGRLLTVDRIVRLPSEKQKLGQTTQALAVDMESFAVAEVCRRHQVRFLAVRVISDPHDEQLPHDIERLVRQTTSLSRLGAAVGTVWQRPGSIKDMYQLRESSLIATDRLAKFLAGTIQQLVPSPPEKTT